jgi:REP element-mobilizing transposase RayT
MAAAPTHLLYVWVGVADVGQHCSDQLSIQPHQRATGLLNKLLQATTAVSSSAEPQLPATCCFTSEHVHCIVRVQPTLETLSLCNKRAVMLAILMCKKISWPQQTNA